LRAIVLLLDDEADEETLIPLFLRSAKRYYYKRSDDLTRIVKFLTTDR